MKQGPHRISTKKLTSCILPLSRLSSFGLTTNIRISYLQIMLFSFLDVKWKKANYFKVMPVFISSLHHNTTK